MGKTSLALALCVTCFATLREAISAPQTTTSQQILVERFCGTVTDTKGQPVEGVQVKMCGVERFHDGRWHRNRRPDCLLPKPVSSDKMGDFVVEFTESAFSLPIDSQKLRVNLWISKTGYAPTYLGGVGPQTQKITISLSRGVRLAGTVRRTRNGQLEAAEGAEVILQCSAGDLAHQKRVLDDPYFFLLGMRRAPEGFDLPFRQRVVTDSKGRYFVTLSPPPLDKRWTIGCGEKAIILDARRARTGTGPDFVLKD